MPQFSISNIPDGYNLEVNVAHNFIESFPVCGDDGYEWLTVATSINIDDNRQGGTKTPVNQLEQFLHCMPKLTKLYMGDTGFEHLPQGVMENLSRNLTAIELPQDTLVCDCYSYWLKEWLQTLAHKVSAMNFPFFHWFQPIEYRRPIWFQYQNNINSANNSHRMLEFNFTDDLLEPLMK